MSESEPREKKRGFLKRLFGHADIEEPQPESEVSDLPAAPETPDTTPVPPPDAEPLPAAPPAPITEPEPPKEGLFARLKKQLVKTKTSLVEKVRQVIQFHGKVDEELLEEIEMILIQADVGVETTLKIVDGMRKKSDARKASDAETLIPLFKEALLEIVCHSERLIRFQPTPPTVVLVIGVNGTGKTTTIGKLAKEYRSQGKKVLLVAGDTFRAAAIEQLTIWAERTGCDIVKQEMGSDPGSVCYDALATGQAGNYDVILIDTAGRLHTRSNLMEELKKVVRVIQKVMPEAPHETLLVLDATTGQNAVSQAKIFSEAGGVTGIIMTKLDGTAKGGILIAIRDLFDIPILKIGIGEQEGDLRDFDPQAFVEALFEA
jgi:fused signal recognition particle receptor